MGEKRARDGAGGRDWRKLREGGLWETGVGGMRQRTLKTGARRGRDEQGTQFRRDGGLARARVSCGVLEVGVSQAPGKDVRTACSPAPGGGRAARVEDGASRRVETRRVSGTL